MPRDAAAAVNAAAVAPSHEVARRSPSRARIVSPAAPVRADARPATTATMCRA
jgi:hypothetical protein